MSSELIINASLPEVRIALNEDGKIQELVIERPTDKGIVGNIYKGKVTRVLPGMQAAFVDIGLEKAAFLYVDDVYVHPEVFGDSDSVEERFVEEETAGPSEEGVGDEEQNLEASTEEANVEETNPEEAISEEGSSEDVSPEGEGDVTTDEGDPESFEMGTDPNDESSPPQGTVSEGGGGGSEDSREAGPRESQAGGAGGEGSSEGGGGGGQGGSEYTGGGGGGRYYRHNRNRRGRHQRGGGGRYGRGGGGGGGGGRGYGHNRGGGGGGGRGYGFQQRRNRDQDPTSSSYAQNNDMPEAFVTNVSDSGSFEGDRTAMEYANYDPAVSAVQAENNRPEGGDFEGGQGSGGDQNYRQRRNHRGGNQFRQKRDRDRRIKQMEGAGRFRGVRASIDELLVEGQEVLVQVAKDPIAAKGARLTCHMSLAGRHLVCMPTIDHIGVSRRIDRDDERRRLRTFVDRLRPPGMGFIVRTASSGRDAEVWINRDIEYLTRLWKDICDRAASVSAPALVYEDLNSIIRSVRDWVTDDVRKVIVDSRYHFNELKNFCERFMPDITPKLELYQGDIPIFDAYGISTELHRALERKVWLKSGGYIVIDQAEALVAIDINTGRYVGKKNLEDTILKTNLEAVEEIAYQLRLRNCGGIIIIDMIDMEREDNRSRVLRHLEACLEQDRTRPTVIGMSELGLIQMTRKRTRDTLVRALCQPCKHCEARGFVKSYTTVAYEVLREIERTGIDRSMNKVLVQAHPDVIDILAIDERDVLDALEKRYRRQVFLQAVADFHPEQFEVVGDEMDTRKKSHPARSRSRPVRSKRNFTRGDSWEGGSSRNPGRQEHHETQESQGESDAAEIHYDSVPAASGVSEEGAGNPGVSEEFVEEVRMSSENENENLGNSLPRPRIGGAGTGGPGGPGDDFSEEDRLAFLRAQAAQDAAVARYSSGSAGPSTGTGTGGGGGTGGHRNGGHRRGFNNRNQRGGKGGGHRNARGPRFGGRGGGGGGHRRSGPGPAGGGGGRVDRIVPREDVGATDSGSASGGGGSDDSGHSSPSTP